MATEFEITEHYNGEIKIKFYPNSHRYKLEDRKDYLIGVTTATGMMDKSNALVGWATKLAKEFLLARLKEDDMSITPECIEEACLLHKVRKEEAGSSGSAVHAWAEAYIKGENPEVPADIKVRNGVLGFLKWVKENDVKFIASEKRIYSRTHEYVGTMDCIFTLGAEDHKIIHAGDFKTSSGIYLEMAFQVAAYQEAETEEHGTVYGDKYILRFQKEDKKNDEGEILCAAGTFEVKRFDVGEHADHFRGFLACLELKKQDKQWEQVHGWRAQQSTL